MAVALSSVIGFLVQSGLGGVIVSAATMFLADKLYKRFRK